MMDFDDAFRDWKGDVHQQHEVAELAGHIKNGTVEEVARWFYERGREDEGEERASIEAELGERQGESE